MEQECESKCENKSEFRGVNRYKNDQCERLADMLGTKWNVEHVFDGSHIVNSMVTIVEGYTSNNIRIEVEWSIDAPFKKPNIIARNLTTKKFSVMYITESWCPAYNLNCFIAANLNVIESLE